MLGPKGTALLETLEGRRLTAYQDGRGVWTIGVGHTAGVKAGDVITDAQCDAFLQQDTATAAAAVDRAVTVPLAPCQRDALILIVFNVGPGQGGVKTGALWRQDGGTPTNLLSAVNSRQRTAAARSFLDFDQMRDPNGRLVEVAGLLRRRMLEAALFLEQPFP
jgi:GH24 family phage-related lysozyme (muramidase)